MTIFKVEGMSCQHCVNSIETALHALKGVKKVQVDLSINQVQVDFEAPASEQQIKDIIDEQGFDVQN